MKTRHEKRQTVATLHRVSAGSDNVFADLGFPKVEAAELAVKAKLTLLIHRRIKRMGLTQVEAAERLGLSQPDVSKLMNGRFTGYTVDRLLALLNALQVDIDIVVRPQRPGRPSRSGVLSVKEKARG
jgi:predicted XRE-type DNA-binding protein